MYLLILIVFIAELIIVSTLIYLILKADKLVCNINRQAVEFAPVLGKTLKELNSVVNGFVDSVRSSCRLVEKKRKHYIKKVIQSMIIYSVLFFFKGRYKRAAVVFQTIVMLKDYWDEKCSL